MKKRFEFAGHTFRITKNFSYYMSYEAFCKGYVDSKELIGKEVEVPNEYGSTTDHTIVEVAIKRYFGSLLT